MALSPIRSIPSSPIKNLPNRRKEIREIIIPNLYTEINNYEQNINDVNEKINDLKEYKDYYSSMIKFFKSEIIRNNGLLNEINAEISKANKISPLEKKRKRSLSRSRSNGGTIKKTRRNRRKTVRR